MSSELRARNHIDSFDNGLLTFHCWYRTPRPHRRDWWNLAISFVSSSNSSTLRLIRLFFLLAPHHGFLDCSKFKRDLDVLRVFPFTVQLNPLITTGKTYAAMNPASQVEELSIHFETILPLEVFCLVSLQTLRVNSTQFAVHYEIDGLTKATGLSPLISRLTRLRVLSLVNTTAAYIPPHSLAVLTNLTHLQVDNCGLREIPSTLSALTNLQELRLSKNHLFFMPDEDGEKLPSTLGQTMIVLF